MSIISMFGGAEAGTVEELNQRLSELSEKFETIAGNLKNLEAMAEDLKKTISNQNVSICNLYSGTETVKHRFEELSNSVASIAHDWNGSEEQGMAKRVADLERMQKYFQSSHGKALNDIHDLKVELHGLYNRQTPPPEDELQQSVDRNPKKKELIDVVQESDFSQFRKHNLLNTLEKNNLTTFESIKGKTFDDLCDIKDIGPASASLLVKLRQKYYGEVDNAKIIRENIPMYSIRDVVKDMKLKQAQKSRIINTLYKYGVNTLTDLSDLEYEEVCKIPHFGSGSVAAVKQIYQNYIWR